ncbi:MAG: hypothetical protein AUK43_04465 [Oscillatoriales cyanobacterium CG2_30_40_61]|nr:MAG: hypothetical protein AUK43_04465 [Oscillatoriales cyanobacterium CG2_30_40_61]
MNVRTPGSKATTLLADELDGTLTESCPPGEAFPGVSELAFLGFPKMEQRREVLIDKTSNYL